MIRSFTLFCKFSQISFSDKQWFDKEVASFHTHGQCCPTCGTREQLSEFGHYSRYLVELHCNQPVVYSLTIPRYRCDSCGHTHALLSSCLVPRRSYSLRFILQVLRCYFLQELTVQQLCVRYRISVATLYEWKKLFLLHKALWLGILEDLQQEPQAFLMTMNGQLLSEFQTSFCFSFMERRSGTAREVQLPAANSPPVIT